MIAFHSFTLKNKIRKEFLCCGHLGIGISMQISVLNNYFSINKLNNIAYSYISIDD